MALRRTAMLPKYRTIPADDGEDGGVDNNAVQSFELEDAHIRRDDRSTRRTFVFTAACIFALLLGMVGYGVHERGDTAVPSKLNGGGEAHGQMNENLAASKTPSFVFCYGDSLTFGMSDLHSRESYPYSKYLEQELNHLFDPDYSLESIESESQTQVPATIVQHYGHPGWTATNMLDHMQSDNDGICSIIHRIPTLSLMIILVGTNDIAQMTNVGKDVARLIIGSIVDVHKGAINCAEEENNSRFHTLAVGIPGSAFQERVPVTSEISLYVNNALGSFAASYPDGKVTYVEFPIPYQEGDDKWGADGLHLTQKGYEVLAKELAPHVKNILDNINSV